MAYWRRFLVAAIGALSLVGSGTVSAAAHEGGTLIEFDSMTVWPGLSRPEVVRWIAKGTSR